MFFRRLTKLCRQLELSGWAAPLARGFVFSRCSILEIVTITASYWVPLLRQPPSNPTWLGLSSFIILKNTKVIPFLRGLERLSNLSRVTVRQHWVCKHVHDPPEFLEGEGTGRKAESMRGLAARSSYPLKLLDQGCTSVLQRSSASCAKNRFPRACNSPIPCPSGQRLVKSSRSGGPRLANTGIWGWLILGCGELSCIS